MLIFVKKTKITKTLYITIAILHESNFDHAVEYFHKLRHIQNK